MISYLIVDDEHMAHDIIKGYCDLLSGFHLARHCYDAIEALEYLREHPVDLIFLDLNMPKLKGFEFLRTLQDPPQVIVTTAYREYALEGYELNIADYLLKPFNFERFLKAVNKALPATSDISKPAQPAPNDRQLVFLRQNKALLQIDLEAIRFIEAAGNYTKITTGDETITIRETISDLLARLDHPDLVQVHKSFAVARKYIQSIEGNRIWIGGQEVPIGKTYKLSFINSLKQL